MKSLLIVLVLLLKFTICFSQNSIKIAGQLFDDNKKPIASAHLVIEGTAIGTLSNDGGFFEIKIPKKYCASILMISYVGYQSVSYKISCENESNLVFNLIESTTRLDSLNIGGLSAMQVVRNAISNLQKNHEVEAVNYKVYMQFAESVENNPSTWRELVANAYHEENFKAEIKIIKARGKGFSKFGEECLKKASMLGVYGLHSHLLLRYPADFLEKGKMDKYGYQFLDDVEIDGQKFYAISIDSERYLKGGNLLIHPATFAIKYIKQIYSDEHWKKRSRVDTSHESFFTESEGKWYLSHGIKFFTLVKHKESRKIVHQNTYFVLDRKFKRAFERKEDIGTSNLMTKPFKLYQGKFDDEFWEDYNYIQLEERFKKEN